VEDIGHLLSLPCHRGLPLLLDRLQEFLVARIPVGVPIGGKSPRESSAESAIGIFRGLDWILIERGTGSRGVDEFAAAGRGWSSFKETCSRC
jgi:hypothetical protein